MFILKKVKNFKLKKKIFLRLLRGKKFEVDVLTLYNEIQKYEFKYTQMAMQLLNIIKVCYDMFGIKNKMRDSNSSFTEALKRIPLHYSLWAGGKSFEVHFNDVSIFEKN